jgi:hypothetical protein
MKELTYSIDYIKGILVLSSVNTDDLKSVYKWAVAGEAQEEILTVTAQFQIYVEDHVISKIIVSLETDTYDVLLITGENKKTKDAGVFTVYGKLIAYQVGK